MIDVYAKHGGNIIAVEPVPDDQAKNYGVVGDRRRRRTRLSHRRHGGEAAPRAPRPPTSPFSAATSSSPKSSTILSAQEQGAGGEIQLTDAMIALLKSQPFYAV